MTTPIEPPRQATARDLFFFRNPHYWPTWPFLPVVRRHADGTMDYGVLYDALHATGRTGYSSTVLRCNFFLLPESETELLALPREVFDTSEEMAAAGGAWTESILSPQAAIPFLLLFGSLAMFELFRAIIDRIKILLATSAALELEADAMARHAARKAELLRLAQQYETEKLLAIALELRQHAEDLDLQQPLVGVTTTLASWQGADTPAALPAPGRESVESLAHSANNRRKTR